jgi:uncharacterized membrane protein
MEFELLLAYVVIYGAIELAYLSSTAAMYRAHFTAVQGSEPRYRLAAAALAYVVLFAVVYHFVIRPVIAVRVLPKLRDVVTNATAMALAIYGVYNLTNLATLTRYSVRLAAIDTAWGILALNTVALACYFLKALALRSV